MRLAALLGILAAAFAFHGTHVHAAPCNRNGAWQDRFPAWSPNGVSIAFVRQLPGCSLPPEAVGVVELGRQASIIERDVRRGSTAPPSWSPTGTRLVFGTSRDTIRTRGEGSAPADVAVGSFPSWGGSEIAYTIENEIRVVGASARTVLNDYSKPSQSNGVAVWSPDATELAFGVRVNAVEGGIGLVNANGTNFHVVGRGLNQSANPTWSPDGRRIAFETNRDGTFDIYSVNADGTDLRNLTESVQVNERLPAWHAGTIAFISDRGKRPRDPYGYALFTMTADAHVQIRRAADLHPYSDVSWSPDGTQIAFASGRECHRWGIYVVDLTTGRANRLTNPCRFAGTNRADVLRGTPFDDFLSGRGGNDTLIGGTGRDVISCGPGRDTVIADKRDRIAADCERVRRG